MALGKVFRLMFVFSVLIISRLDSQNKFQMFTLFSVRHIGVPGLCKFLRNISTNICLGRRTSLKLEELSYLFIFYNITIS